MTTTNADGERIAEKKPPLWLKRDGLAEWFAGKDPAELDVVEVEGRFAIEETIHRRMMKTGEIESVLVRVWVPTSYDRAKSRIDCLEWIKRFARTKERPTWTEACELLGPAYVDELDTVCLLARCVRDHDAPEYQHLLPELLDERYGRSALIDFWDRLNHHDFQADPRSHEMDEETFWGVVQGIAKVRNCSPLAAIDGRVRDSFVLTMAERLWSSRTSSSA